MLEGLGLGRLAGPALGGTHTYVPHGFRQDFGGFFRHKDVAGKPVVSRVLSDKPEVPVGGQQSVWVAQTPPGTFVALCPAIMAPDPAHTSASAPPHLLVVLRMVSTERDVF